MPRERTSERPGPVPVGRASVEAAHLGAMTDQTPATVDPVVDPVLADDMLTHGYMGREFERVIGRIADDLVKLGEQVRRVERPRPNQGDPGFTRLAAQVSRDVLGVMSRLGIEQLIDTGREADNALMEERIARARAADVPTPVQEGETR